MGREFGSDRLGPRRRSGFVSPPGSRPVTSRIIHSGRCVVLCTMLGIGAIGTAPTLADQPAVRGTTGPIFTASDFPAMALGVDPGIVGEATVRVWDAAERAWTLSVDGDT